MMGENGKKFDSILTKIKEQVYVRLHIAIAATEGTQSRTLKGIKKGNSVFPFLQC